MIKLVIVGMRFCNSVAVAELQTGHTLYLCGEKNSQGVDGKAIRVENGPGHKIGYVRNQDLTDHSKLLKPILSEVEDSVPVVITRVCTNYLLVELDPKSLESTQSKHDDINDTLKYAFECTNQIDEKVNELDELTDLGVSDSLKDLDRLRKTYTSTQYFPDSVIEKLIPAKTEPKKETKMKFNANSIRDSFFRELKNVVIDIQTGKFGFATDAGIAVYVEGDVTGTGSITVNPITDLGVKIPAFAMRLPVSELKAGDIIVSGNDTFFFHRKVASGYEVMTAAGEIRSIGSVSNMFFGSNTVLAAKSMFGNASGGMNPMMMAMMMGDNSEGFDMKTFALMSMMGSQAGGDSNNMLMMAMLMGGK